MKLDLQTREIEKSGNITDNTFKVKSTGKMFKILSSGLYKNKIKAVVREISTNAIDAHIQSDILDKPFIVHLPTALELFFSVRDFGPGLSKTEIFEIYTQYGESTKTNSNDYIGALGLGCKSPFAYTDVYTVSSIQSNVKTIYSMYLNEYDCPVVSELSKTNTDQLDGLEVIVPVKSSYDSNLFAHEAQNVYEYFNVKPNMIGAKIKFLDKKLLLDFGYAKFYENGSPGGRIIMGNIAYPIDYNQLIPKIKNLHLQNQLRNFINCDFDIYVENGSIDFTAGREDLSYDDRITVPKLVQMHELILSDITKILDKDINNLKNEFEARNFYSKVTSYSSPYSKLIKNFIYDGFVWNNQRIKSSIVCVDFDEHLTLKILTLGYSNKGLRPIKKMAIEVDKDKKIHIECCRNLIFVVDDCKSFDRKIKGLSSDKFKESTIYSLHSTDLIVIDAFLKNFPGSEIIKASELQKVKSTSTIKNKTWVKQLNSHNARTKGYIADCSPVEVDFEAGGLYFISNGVYLDNIDNSFISEKILLPMILETVKDKTIYVVPKTLSAKFIRSDKWINVLDIAEQEFIKQANLLDVEKIAYVYNTEFYEFSNMFDTLKNSYSLLIKEFCDLYEEYDNLRKETNKNLFLLSKIGIVISEKTIYTNVKKLEPLKSKIQKKYPLLITLNNSNIQKDSIDHYIKICDFYQANTCK